MLLANVGNADWRPCLNLWAVLEYVTKYAVKAPDGSRQLGEVLRGAVDEVCKYTPKDADVDLLRRSLQKFYARTLGERSYGVFEAVHLGLSLPLVVPMMEVVSLNTFGSRRLKTAAEMRKAAPDDPVVWDSRVDKFDKRLALLRKQYSRASQADALQAWEAEVRDV